MYIVYISNKTCVSNGCVVKGVGGGKVLSLSFFFIFTYVVELSFLVSKSAHLSSNSRRFRFYRRLKVGRRSEKWPENTVF